MEEVVEGSSHNMCFSINGEVRQLVKSGAQLSFSLVDDDDATTTTTGEAGEVRVVAMLSCYLEATT